MPITNEVYTGGSIRKEYKKTPVEAFPSVGALSAGCDTQSGAV